MWRKARRLAGGPGHRKLASAGGSRHGPAMRRCLAFAALFLSACATAPQTAPEPARPQVVPAQPQERGDLIGLTAADLIQRFGTPTLQIREGHSLKLQFRAQACVLDAYLYPSASGQGVARVTHVDTRLRSGADINQASCISALSGA